MKGYKKAEGKHGNYLDTDAIASRSNFLTDKIKTLVQYEVYQSHQHKKLISEPRIWENLLSSQPLAFNLFGEMHFDLKLATKFFIKLYPEHVSEVTKILFEHSPAAEIQNIPEIIQLLMSSSNFLLQKIRKDSLALR